MLYGRGDTDLRTYQAVTLSKFVTMIHSMKMLTFFYFTYLNKLTAQKNIKNKWAQDIASNLTWHLQCCQGRV